MNSTLTAIGTHKALAVGLWIAALGTLLQALTGAKGVPKVPPGILILAVIGIIVYATSRLMWTAILGLFLAAMICLFVFTTPGTAYHLAHPENVGPLVGTLVQLIGLLFALVEGIATLIIWFSGGSGHRGIPQNR